ncbi:hypothetical protein C8Q74DRAFT_1370154 [Fomes fomentarius]|nr:hypothetical protein C8Q74DRAFT_1370154 [Fomes fomentarius]
MSTPSGAATTDNSASYKGNLTFVRPYKVLRSTQGHPQLQDRTGSEENSLAYPRRIRKLTKEDFGSSATVVQITGGERHILSLTSDRRVFACGSLVDGQFGLADVDDALTGSRKDEYVCS